MIARAIVENGLKGWKDWRYAKDPQRWIGRVARDIASDIAVEEPPTHNQETGDWELTEPVEIAFGTPAESDSRCTIIRLYHFDLLRSEAQRQSRHRVVDYIDRLEEGLNQGVNSRDIPGGSASRWDGISL